MTSLYERVGGQQWFDDLVERFYEGVEGDPVLRPMYPEDLTEAKRHLALFLGQYWGGPATYMEERGHPRLRMRHVPFVIGRAERDAWMRHMSAAVEASKASGPISSEDEAALLDYFSNAATFMINDTAPGGQQRLVVRAEQPSPPTPPPS